MRGQQGERKRREGTDIVRGCDGRADENRSSSRVSHVSSAVPRSMCNNPDGVGNRRQHGHPPVSFWQVQDTKLWSGAQDERNEPTSSSLPLSRVWACSLPVINDENEEEVE